MPTFPRLGLTSSFLKSSFALLFAHSTKARRLRSWLAVGAALAFVATAGAQTAQLAPAVTGTVSVGDNPYGVAVNLSGTAAYVTNPADNNVSVIDLATNTVTTTIPVGSGPTAVAVSPAGYVYVANSGSNIVSVIDPATNTVIATVTVGNTPLAIAVSGTGPQAGDVYVANAGDNTVSVINPATNTVIATINVGNDPLGVAVSPAGPEAGDVFVTSRDDGTVSVINSATDMVIATISVGYGPQGLAVSPAGTDAYVANYNSDTVSVIDLATNTVTATVAVGTTPGHVAVDPAGKTAYVTNAGGNSVSAIDLATNTVIATVAVGAQPFGVAVNPAGTTAYVANLTDHTVSVIALPQPNFGSANVCPAGSSSPAPCSQSKTETFRFGNVTQQITALHVKVLTQGAAGLDFTDALTGTCDTGAGVLPITASANSGVTCTVKVNFNPTVPGLRSGAILLFDQNNTLLGEGYIYGTGTGPQVAFSGNALAQLGGTTVSIAASIAVDSSGNTYVLAPPGGGSSAVWKVPASDPACSTPGDCIQLGSGLLDAQGVAVDGAGNLFISDTGNSRVVELPWTGSGYGTQVTVASGLHAPEGLAVDGAGDLYVTLYSGNSAVMIPWTGDGYGASVSIGGDLSPGLNSPTSIAVDPSGYVYIADTVNSRVVKIPPTDLACATAADCATVGTGLSIPTGVAVDAAGEVYIANVGNNDVVEVPWTGSGYGTQTTVISNLNGARELALDSAGNLYVTSLSEGAYKLDRWDAPSLTFADTNVFSGSSSDSPQTVTVANIGNSTLTFPPPTNGNNPSAALANDFTLDSSPSTACPQLDTSSSAYLLAAGASCTLTIDFAPQDLGSDSGSLVLTDNSLNAQPTTYTTQTINFSGNGEGAATTTVAPDATATYSAALQSVTLTATVTSTSTVNAGTVTFTVLQGTTAIGTISASVVNGVAGSNVSLPAGLAAGTYTIQAVYNGSSGLAASSDSSHHLYVESPTTTTVAANLTAPWSSNSQTVQLTINVTSTAGPVTGGILTIPAFVPVVSGSGTTYNTVLEDVVFTGSPFTRTLTIPAGMTAGTYTLPVLYSDPTNTFSTSGDISHTLTITIPDFVVNTPGDDPGAANLCSPQTTPGQTTTGDTCSLRDALLAAASAGGANISFDSLVFSASSPAAARTITLAYGTLNIPSNTTITGATSGSGATLQNLVTVSGGGSSSNFSVFTVNSGVTGAVVNNLKIVNGYTNAGGGGINNDGSLIVSSSTFSGNSATGTSAGGGIFNSGMLTVSGSTFSNNSASFDGGGIYSSVSLIVTASTFYGNSASTGGGILNDGGTLTVNGSTFFGNTSTIGTGAGIYTGGTVTMANSILAGNSDNSYADNFTFGGTYINRAGNLVGNGSGSVSPDLSALGNYGGPTETMIPLPGSPAICAGLAANVVGSTDQRGLPNTNSTYAGYTSTPCVDAGAVQTNYSLKFDVQPSTVVQNVAMSPAPQVELDESGSAFADGADTVAIPLTLITGPGTLTGGSASTSATTAIATYSSLSISLPGSLDQLLALVPLNPAATPAPAIGLASNPFQVMQAVTQLAFSSAPPAALTAGGNAGTVTVAEENALSQTISTAGDVITLMVTGPGGYSTTYTSTAVSGVATFNLSGATLTAAGTYTYTASVTLTDPVTNATVNETVNAGPAVSLAVSGYPTSWYVNAGSFVGVTAFDQYQNIATSYNGAVSLTANELGAQIGGGTGQPAPTNLSKGQAVFEVTFPLPRTISITASSGSLVSTPETGIVIQQIPKYVVTVATDTTTGVPANCTDQSLPGATPDANCSLRDALYAAGNFGGGNITFSSAVFNAPTTITLANGPLFVGQLTTVTGPTTGSGSTLSNLVTVSGPPETSGLGSSLLIAISFSDSPVLGGTGLYLLPASFANLNFANGDGSAATGDGSGASVINAGELNFTHCAFTGNKGDLAGAIYNFDGLMNISGSSFTGNSSSGAGTEDGGAIFADVSGPVFEAADVRLNKGDKPVLGPLASAAASRGRTLGLKAPPALTDKSFAQTRSQAVASGMFQRMLDRAPASLRTLLKAKPMCAGISCIGGGSGGGAGGIVNIDTSTFSGNSGYYTGGIYNLDELNLTNSTFTSNTAQFGAGAMVSDWAGTVQFTGILTVLHTTFTGNTGPYAGALVNVDSAIVNALDNTFTTNNSTGNGHFPDAGAIFNFLDSQVFAGYNTFFGNTSTSNAGAGALINDGQSSSYMDMFAATVSGNSGFYGGASDDKTNSDLGNSIVSGNTTTDANAVSDGITADNNGMHDDGGNVIGSAAVDLAPLGNYGGSTETMLPLPGSTAICAGNYALLLAAESNFGYTFPGDQRGAPVTNKNYPGFASTPCVDAGAVQSNYALSFSTNPPATLTVDTPFSAGVTLDENGAPLVSPVTIPLSLNGPGMLTGGSAQTASGVASYPALTVSTAATGDSLSASLPLNSALTPSLALTANSSVFTAALVPTTTALKASSTSITPLQSVTLTATVTSNVAAPGSPAGTVSFYDGATLLGTVNLSGGTASYTAASLAPGVAHIITATYNGNSEFATSTNTTSTTVTVAPLDFVMTLMGPTNLTVIPGQSISYQVQVTPDYGAYAGTVSFAIAGLPPGATVTFSPPTIAANGGTQTITITIKTAPATAMERERPAPSARGRLAPFALAFVLLAGAGALRRRGKMLRGLLCVAVLIGSGLAAVSLSGCGSNSGFFTQTPQNYTVTVTATAGNLQHTSTITLNVQ